MSTKRDYAHRPRPLPKWASVLIECAIIAFAMFAMGVQL